MKPLINIGKSPDVAYVDPNEATIIISDEQRGYGTIVHLDGMAVRSAHAPEDVFTLLSGGKLQPFKLMPVKDTNNDTTT